MAVPSYLSTFLWMQQLRGADVFATRFPGLWAVWEPGPWRPAADVKRTISFGGETGAPTAGGDYLCFHLGAADGRVVSLGREAGNDIVVNDSTVSRQHVQFFAKANAWWVRPHAGRTATLAGEPVELTGAAVSAGQELQLGGARFTFHDPAGLIRRLGK
jgi:hypothetical protein